MKKFLIGVILLLVVLGVGVPFVSGLVMEKIVKNSYQDLNKIYADSGSGVTVEIVEYDRNVFSSEIEWKVKLGSLSSVYDMEEIILIDRADHGYAGVDSITSLEKNKWYSELVNNKLNGKNPLHISTKYKLSGEVNSTISLDAFSYQHDEKQFEIKQGTIVTECEKGLKSISSKAFWDGFSLSDKFSMEGLSMDMDLEMISTYILDGKTSYEIKSLIVEEDQAKFGLKNLNGTYVLDFQKKNNTMSFEAEYGVGSISAGQQKIKNAFVRVGLKKLNATGYEEFMEVYVDTMRGVLGDAVAAEDNPEKLKMILEQQMSAAGIQMVALGEKLLRKGLEVSISDLRVELPSGDITGDIVLGLNRDITLAEFVPIMNQPQLLFEIFSLKSDVSLPASIVGDNPMLLSPAYEGMQTGLFVKNGENLVHKAETKDGKLFVNGEEVVLN